MPGESSVDLEKRINRRMRQLFRGGAASLTAGLITVLIGTYNPLREASTMASDAAIYAGTALCTVTLGLWIWGAVLSILHPEPQEEDSGN